jgi:hypothetical protein
MTKHPLMPAELPEPSVSLPAYPVPSTYPQ